MKSMRKRKCLTHCMAVCLVALLSCLAGCSTDVGVPAQNTGLPDDMPLTEEFVASVTELFL